MQNTETNQPRVKMTREIIYYDDEHYCQPNETGEYQFVCSKNGVVKSQVPVLLRNFVYGTCLCGKEIIRAQRREPLHD